MTDKEINIAIAEACGIVDVDQWGPWFAELKSLAERHGIITSDDADLWWDDFGIGKTPQESMSGFLTNHQPHLLKEVQP